MEPETKEEHEKPIQSEMHSKGKIKLNIQNIFIAAAILLGIILIINFTLASSLKGELKKNLEDAKEKARPAKIELAVIGNSKCSDCFDISSVVSTIKSSNVNITSEKTLEFNSAEGKQIINKYKIQKIPSMVITGEIEKISIQGLKKNENALLFESLTPPYTNAATGKIESKVTLYNLVDPECKKCNNLDSFIAQIKGAGIKISEQENISVGSDEGKELVKKYKIGFAPTIIMSEGADAYGIMQSAWPQIGTKESDGSYVLRIVYPPFINLTTGDVKGIVTIIYLTDKSCTECYDVNQHKLILTSPQSFDMTLDKEEKVDISDSNGKVLIARYNITQVPTVILSSEAGSYPSSQGLKQFFSVEKDGSYVFRMLSAVGNYKDLSKNEVVKVQQNAQQ